MEEKKKRVLQWTLEPSLVEKISKANVLREELKELQQEVRQRLYVIEKLLAIPRISKQCGIALPPTAIDWLLTKDISFSLTRETDGEYDNHTAIIRLLSNEMFVKIDYYSSFAPKIIRFNSGSGNHSKIFGSVPEMLKLFKLNQEQSDRWRDTLLNGHDVHPCKYYFTEEEWVEASSLEECTMMFFCTMANIKFKHENNTY